MGAPELTEHGLGIASPDVVVALAEVIGECVVDEAGPEKRSDELIDGQVVVRIGVFETFVHDASSPLRVRCGLGYCNAR